MTDFSSQVYDPTKTPPGESIILLAWGGIGTGKTEFCGSVGPTGLIINTGQGKETLESPGFKNRHKNTSAKVIDVSEKTNPKTGIFDTAQAFDTVCEIMDWALLNDDIKTICIDDATFFNRFAKNRALEINLATGKSQTLNTARAQGIMMMAVQDYGTEMGAIEWFLATYVPLFRQAKKHFVVTAHERYFFNKAESIGAPRTVRRTVPSFTGETFPDTVGAFFDLVWRFKTTGAYESMKYRVYTVGTEDEMIKTRYGGIFKPIEENITFPQVIARIQQSKGEAK